jgi:diphthine synthase
MFYLIGLGLSDEKDITLRGLEVFHFRQIWPQVYSDNNTIGHKVSTRVYLEAYTSILTVQKERLARLISELPIPWAYTPEKEELYGKPLVLADRDMIETESDEILRDATLGTSLSSSSATPLARQHTPTSSSAPARSASRRASYITRLS